MNYNIAVYMETIVNIYFSLVKQNVFRVCVDLAFIAKRTEQAATLRDFRISFYEIRNVCEIRECLVDKRCVLTSI